jgi:hypothetical protein
MRNRYYDPQTGRFLQRDPVWSEDNVGGWHSFAGNSPLSRQDPFGLQSNPPEDKGWLGSGGMLGHALGKHDQNLAERVARGEDVSPEEIERANVNRRRCQAGMDAAAKAVNMGAAALPTGETAVAEAAAGYAIGEVVDRKTDPAGSVPGGEPPARTGEAPARPGPPPPRSQTPAPPTPPGASPPAQPVTSAKPERPFDEALWRRLMEALQKSYDEQKKKCPPPEQPRNPPEKKKGRIVITLSDTPQTPPKPTAEQLRRLDNFTTKNPMDNVNPRDLEGPPPRTPPARISR